MNIFLTNVFLNLMVTRWAPGRWRGCRRWQRGGWRCGRWRHPWRTSKPSPPSTWFGLSWNKFHCYWLKHGLVANTTDLVSIFTLVFDLSSSAFLLVTISISFTLYSKLKPIPHHLRFNVIRKFLPQVQCYNKVLTSGSILEKVLTTSSML